MYNVGIKYLRFIAELFDGGDGGSGRGLVGIEVFEFIGECDKRRWGRAA